MPYRNNRELPDAVKNVVPSAAGRTTWRTIYNNAAEQYGEDSARAFATAWSGLQAAGWAKNEEGQWVKKAADPIRFLAKNVPQRYTLGVVYEPNMLDTDEEFASLEVIEKACWGFMRKLQEQSVTVKQAGTLIEALCKAAESVDGIRVDVTELLDAVEKGRLGDQHTSWDDEESQVVECYLAPADMEIGEERITKGTWLLGVVWSEEAFAKIETGERTGLSMGGYGTTVEAAMQEVRDAA